MTPTEPTLRLRPMTAEEYPAAIAATRDGYATDMEERGGMLQEAAQRQADADIAAVLPDGLATPGHALFVLDLGGESVGRLWLAEREIGGRTALFIYELAVDQEHRGRGRGRSAMLLAEEVARSRGIRRIELNVFGGNGVARNLYRSLGYAETSVQMAKDLA